MSSCKSANKQKLKSTQLVKYARLSQLCFTCVVSTCILLRLLFGISDSSLVTCLGRETYVDIYIQQTILASGFFKAPPHHFFFSLASEMTLFEISILKQEINEQLFYISVFSLSAFRHGIIIKIKTCY